MPNQSPRPTGAAFCTMRLRVKRCAGRSLQQLGMHATIAASRHIQDRSMQIRNLGGSGLRVSAVGLGCNNFGQRTDLETSRKVIHKAIDLGVTLFDTADIYAGMGGSETVLGTVLGDRRKDIVLATKFSKPMANDGTRQGASRRYIMSAVEASLKRLKTDYIDLLPAARLRSADPHRGNLARARRSRSSGQGPLYRQFEFSGLAGRGSRIRGARDERQPLRLLPGRVQPARARHRERICCRQHRNTGSGYCRSSRSPADC